MADSFAGTSISVSAVGTMGDAQQVAKHVHHIPGGDNNVADFGGKQERVISLPLMFSSVADWDTFRGLMKTTGTLVYILGTISNATLDSIALQQVIVNSGGVAKIIAIATWTIP